jgi:hypothetical protein
MKPWVKDLIIFTVGLLVGVAGTGIYIRHCFSRSWVNSGNHQHVVDVIDSELSLTPDEKTKVAKIFDDAAPAMEALRVETNKKLKTIRDNTSTQIRLVLTVDQQKKYDALKAKWDSKLNTNDKGWHIPGLPPGPPSSGPCTMPAPCDNSTPISK